MCGGLVDYNTDISSNCWRGGQRWDTLKPYEFVTVNVAKIHLCWTAGKRALQSPRVTSKAGRLTYIVFLTLVCASYYQLQTFEMATPRAPKQWCLKPSETLTSFENWRQNLQYILALDPNFATFLSDCVTWKKKDKSTPHRGFTDDASTVPEGVRKTAAQKAALLELMLGQIANYAGVISRNTIIKKSTSLESIWETIRAHYHFQSTGARFLDFAQLKLKPGERAEDLYQRLMSFVEDSLLRKDGKLLHNDEALSDDEEMTPTLENLVVLIWLRLIHEDLPRLVQQRYRTELRSHTLATIKPEISQALDSLLDELHSNQEVRAMRAAAAQGRSNFRPQKAQGAYRPWKVLEF